MRFDLREEAINEFLGNIEKYAEELHTNNMVLQKQLNEVLSQTQYEMLQRLMDEVVRNYNENVVDASKGILVEWCESEDSLKPIMHHYKVGEKAEKICGDLDKKVIEKFGENLNMISLEYQKPERPKVSKEDFERVEQVFQQYEKELEETYSAFRNKIKELIKENEIYLCVPALVSLLQKTNMEFVEFAKGRVEKLEAHIEQELMNLSIIEGNFDNKEPEQFLFNTDNKGCDIATYESDTISMKDTADDNVNQLLSDAISDFISNGKHNSFFSFVEITKFIYNTIESEYGNKNKLITLEMVNKFIDVYYEFYEIFGEFIEDFFVSQEEKIKYIDEEYINVLVKRNCVQYFDDGAFEKYVNNVQTSYSAFAILSKMIKNLTEESYSTNVLDESLVYGMHVLVSPIIFKGRVNYSKVNEYIAFSDQATEKILKAMNLLDRIDDIRSCIADVPERLLRKSKELVEPYDEEMENEIKNTIDLSDDLFENIDDVEQEWVRRLLVESFIEFKNSCKKYQAEEENKDEILISDEVAEVPRFFLEKNTDNMEDNIDLLQSGYAGFCDNYALTESETKKFFDNSTIKLLEKCCTSVVGKLMDSNTGTESVDKIIPKILKYFSAYVIDKMSKGKKKSLHRLNDVLEGSENIEKYLTGAIMKEAFRLGSGIEKKANNATMSDYIREKFFIEKGFEEESWCVKDGINCFYAPVHYVVNKMKTDYGQKDIEKFEKTYFYVDDFIQEIEDSMINNDVQLSEKKRRFNDTVWWHFKEKWKTAEEYENAKKQIKFSFNQRTNLRLYYIKSILKTHMGDANALHITKLLCKYYEEDYGYKPNEQVIKALAE